MLFDVAPRPISTKETSIGTTVESRTPKVTRHPKIEIMKKMPPSPSSLLPPISIIFERCEKQLKQSLNLPQDVLDRAQELIEECRPYVAKNIKKYQHKALGLDVPILDLLPRYLQPEMMIGACLYLSCKEKGIDISQFEIAKAQGHYDTSALSKTIREIRTNLCMRYPKVKCPQCGKEIFLVYPDDPFCSTKCRREYKKMSAHN
jgi:transcription initiation factor TFIIIB Brf1 subunit/transcription initiation factor TFIIB